MRLPQTIAFLVIAVGVLLLVVGQGGPLLRRAGQVDAAGDLALLEYKVARLQADIADSNDSGANKKREEQIKEIREKDGAKKELKARKAAAHAANGGFGSTFLALIGFALTAAGLLALALGGSENERLEPSLRAGALIALVLLLAFAFPG